MNTCNTGWNGTTCWPNVNGPFNAFPGYTGFNGVPTNIGGFGGFACPPVGFNGCTPTGFNQPFASPVGVSNWGTSNWCGPTNGFAFAQGTPAFNPTFGAPIGCAPWSTPGMGNWAGHSYSPNFYGPNSYGSWTSGGNAFQTPWGFAPNGCIGSACPEYTGAGCCMTNTIGNAPSWYGVGGFQQNTVQTCFGPVPCLGPTQCVPTIAYAANGMPIPGLFVNGCFIPASILAALCPATGNVFGGNLFGYGFGGPVNAAWTSPWTQQRTVVHGTPTNAGCTPNAPYGTSNPTGNPINPNNGAPITNGTPTVNPYAAAAYANGGKPVTGYAANPYANATHGVPTGHPTATGTPSGIVGANYANSPEGCCQPLARNAA